MTAGKTQPATLRCYRQLHVDVLTLDFTILEGNRRCTEKNEFENPSTIFEIVDLKSGWCSLQQEKQRAYPHTQLVSSYIYFTF